MGFHFRQTFLNRFNSNRWDVASHLLLGESRLSGVDRRLLDIGAGGGKFMLKVQAGFHQIYGIDVRANAIRSATELAAENLQKGTKAHFVVCDANTGLCFVDSCFDAVTILATLEHLPEYRFLLREVSRVLKENGILIVQVENRDWVLHRLRVLRDEKFNKNHPEIPPAIHPFRIKELLELMEENDFGVIKVTCSGLLAHFRKHISLLSPDLVIKSLKHESNRGEVQ